MESCFCFPPRDVFDWLEAPLSRSSSSKSSSSLQWQQLLNTDEILAQDIQTWFSYLLSGLDKKFRPDNMASMVAAADTDVRATYRKVSA